MCEDAALVGPYASGHDKCDLSARRATVAPMGTPTATIAGGVTLT
jgi:hypothetical protein